ncbi:AzlC family ABC transporter permease [Tianweitania sp. BSSL-BM11]|uniref:AzlC family ABC transporter permease n=1 Tax=Tianweitania aestuarii TaxID=2814886 RepID=A0ABS5RV35_9HYPH|nr:AzlC family ABC transporter permease [Tianweitania aestuarii]MBS9720909.1 AzlC family ABC transporter permease [Tianweitania aestuarii]
MPLANPSREHLSDFWRGLRVGLPIFVASAPFAVLFGAMAVENGLSVVEAVLMSAVIFGGASQMVGIELFGQHIAPWLIILSIFAVNFRHVLYSAALGRNVPHWSPLIKAVAFFFLVDPVFAESERRVENGKPVDLAWYAGIALPMFGSWVFMTWLGAAFGGQVMLEARGIGLDFLLPIYFLGLVMGFRGRPRWLPVVAVSAIASMVAYRTIGSPWHVSVGAMAGILLAAALPPRVIPVEQAAMEATPS